MLNLVSCLFHSALSLLSLTPCRLHLVGSGIAAHLTTQLARRRTHPTRAPFHNMSRPINRAIPSMLLPIQHPLTTIAARPMHQRTLASTLRRRHAQAMRTTAMHFRELNVALLKHVADVPVQPHALQLGGIHVAGAGDAALARGRAAEAVEGLRHGPLSAGVEEGELRPWVQACWAREDGERGHVEDLLLELRSAFVAVDVWCGHVRGGVCAHKLVVDREGSACMLCFDFGLLACSHLTPVTGRLFFWGSRLLTCDFFLL